jgi:hypothetical protein
MPDCENPERGPPPLAGEHDLHSCERSERHRGDMQEPGADRDEHPDREPARAEQRFRGVQGPGGADVRSKLRTALLEEERDVREEGAADRQEDSELDHFFDWRRASELRPVSCLSVGRCRR